MKFVKIKPFNTSKDCSFSRIKSKQAIEEFWPYQDIFENWKNFMIGNIVKLTVIDELKIAYNQ